MEEFKGPTIHRRADEGVRYRTHSEGGRIDVTIKVSNDDPGFNLFSVVEYAMATGARLPVHSCKWTERVLICSAGAGVITLGDEQVEVRTGAVVFCGHGVPLSVDNQAQEPLHLFVTSYPPGLESRTDFLTRGDDGGLVQDVPEEAERIFGQLHGSSAAQLPRDQRGHAAYSLSDADESYWQADPTAGYIAVKLAPPSFRLNSFGVSAQMLEPGAFVREHGHSNTDEIIFVLEGEGTVFIDGAEHDFGAGAMAVLGRNALHRIVNTGSGEYRMTGIFNPPGIERALRETGVKRDAGSPRPQGIPRNAETGRLLVEKYGFIIPGGGG